MSYKVYDRCANSKGDLKNTSDPDGSVTSQSCNISAEFEISYCFVNARITQKYARERKNATARTKALFGISTNTHTILHNSQENNSIGVQRNTIRRTTVVDPATLICRSISM
jgi:hypothetical protein